MKLITRYNQYIFPALIVLFLLSTTSSYFLIKKVLQDELDETLLRTRSRIMNYLQIHQSLPAINSFDDQKILFEKITGPQKTELSSTTQIIAEQKKNHISRQLSFSVEIKNQFYLVSIREPLEGTSHLTRLLLKIAVLTVLIVLVVVFIINRQVISRVWAPFYQSLALIKDFKVTDPDKLVFPLSPIEEFTQLNIHFGIAAENATRDFKNLKEFSENASHEIQTPLAIIHAKLDLLTQQENLTERQSELLQSLFSSVTKLSSIQQSLLLLTKIDNRQFEPSIKVQLHQILACKLEEFQDLMAVRNLQCHSSLDISEIKCNKELLNILLDNLISNAIRHNLPNGVISVRLKCRQLKISNSGFAEPLDPKRIFRRFYKGSSSGENNGLGLSIVRQICDSSGIQICYLFENKQHTFQLNW